MDIKKLESEDPCYQCLDNPANAYSKKPVYFEEEDQNGKKKNH